MIQVDAVRIPIAPPVSDTTAATPQRFDVQNMPFTFLMEITGDTGKLSRAVSRFPGWSVTNAPADCSHWGHYSHVHSPRLTLAEGGLRRVRDVLEALEAAGAAPGNSGAMRLSVSQSVLTDEGATHLIRLLIANEDIIYRLAQNGGTGRPLGHKASFCKPLSQVYSQVRPNTVAEWTRSLNHHHPTYGVTTRKHGEWQFRYFDSSLNRDAVANNIRLWTGMIGAAMDGRGSFDQRHPANEGSTAISAVRFRRLLEAALPGESWKGFEEQLTATGARVEGLSVDSRAALELLQARQYGFLDRSGAPASLDAIEVAVDDNAELVMQDPTGHRTRCAARGIDTLLRLTGHGDPELKAQYDRAARLLTQGVVFKDSTGEALQPLDVVLRTDGTNQPSGMDVQAHLPHRIFWKCWPRQVIHLYRPRDVERLTGRIEKPASRWWHRYQV